MKMIIKNISELIQTEEKSRKWVSGKNMAKLNTIKDAFIEIDNGKISSFGCMDNWKGIEDWNSTEVIEELVQIKGIGEWTAQCYLLSCLKRIDVWPAADLGLMVAIQKLILMKILLVVV